MANESSGGLARTVREAIASHGVTQYVVAEKLGLSQAAVSRRLAGKVEFRSSELEAVAELLAVPVADLYRAAA